MRTVLSEVDLAFEEGYKAHENKENISSNPYPKGTEKSTAWYRGWERAEECSYGRCND